MEVKATAYFLARMKLNTSPFPRIIEFRTASQGPGAMTCLGSEIYAEVLRAEGASYQEAHDRLVEIIRSLKWDWAEVWINESFEAHQVRGALTGPYCPL